MNLTSCQWTGCPCSQPTLPGKSYCLEHYEVVYQKGTALRRRHKDLRTVDKVRIVEELMNEAIAELEAEGFDVYGARELTGADLD